MGNFWDQRAYAINESAGTLLEITVDGENDVSFGIYDSFGAEITFVDDSFDGIERGSALLQFEDPHFLVVEQLTEGSGDFLITSSHALSLYDDPHFLKRPYHMGVRNYIAALQ